MRNYFTKIKLITSCSKWTRPYNNERMRYNKIRLKTGAGTEAEAVAEGAAMAAVAALAVAETFRN